MRTWGPSLVAVIIYPALVVTGVGVVPASFVPLLAIWALLSSREDPKAVRARPLLYLAFTVPSLFSLSYTLSGIVGIREYLTATWALVWLAAGVLLYFRERQPIEINTQGKDVSRLRVIHGGIALVLLVGFLIAHLINHDVAAWSVDLQKTVMTTLRLWYRAGVVEPVLLILMLAMIATGVPMVAHYARQRMDAFRLIQTATGVYVGVFLVSHIVATLNARRLGIETDWTFAAGPVSLIESGGPLLRLIPHYFFGPLCLIVHAACGLRIVLLKHGLPNRTGGRLVAGLAVVGLLITALAMAALLGFHAA